MGILVSQGPCMYCNSSDAGTYYDDGYKCFSCGASYGFRGPQRPVRSFSSPNLALPIGLTYNPSEFSYEALRWLYQYYVDEKLIRKYSIGYDRETSRVFLPVVIDGELTSYSSRAVTPSKYKYITKGKKKMFTTGPGTTSIVLTEDFLSCIRVGEVMDSAYLQGTSLGYKDAQKLLQAYDEIIIWLDGDEAGVDGAAKIKAKLQELEMKSLLRNLWHNSPKRVIIRVLSTDKDPKCYTTKEIQELLNVTKSS